MRVACSITDFPTTRFHWFPSVLRFNPHDSFLYVAEADDSSKEENSLFAQGIPESIIKFKDDCFTKTEVVFYTRTPTPDTLSENDHIIDFAFGNSNTMFVLVANSFTFFAVYMSSNIDEGPMEKFFFHVGLWLILLASPRR